MKADAPLRPLSAILDSAGEPGTGMQPVEIGEIDFARPFVPEENTHLFYTPIYETLTHPQRLRYNQLFGVRINEFIMTLERDILERVLVPLRRHPRVRTDSELTAGLELVIEDEREHYATFAELNRQCLPDVYTDGRDRYFTELGLLQKVQFAFFGLVARRLSFPLYAMMAMEESSMTMTRRMTHLPPSHGLGSLEPTFVAVHREHTKDEAAHVEIQAHLIQACLIDSGRLSRWSNSKLFKVMLRGLTTVGRSGSGAKVIRRLVHEHPELTPREEEMIHALTTLGRNTEYQRSIFSRTLMPKAFALFDQVPEFQDLPDYMAGYERS
ncbi:MAG TPA: hypothetical protein VLA09_02805 [Longimicrobiales bacterium]|nr:hypothetical protein [Longimicrobiales bacterium]